MKELFFAVLCAFSCIVYAEPKAKELFTAKMAGVEVSQMGMCDGLRTTLVIHRSGDGRMVQEFIGFSGVRYVVIKEGADEATAKKVYFTKSGNEVIINKTPAEWSAPLLHDGPNFFMFHFFPDRPNDCALSQPMR